MTIAQDAQKMYLSTIPFAGFYNSIHDSEVDHEFSHMFQDDRGVSISDELETLARDAVDWSGVYRAYAKDYSESFLQWLGLDGAFESISSPREYNFETDRVFVNLTRADLTRIIRGVDKETLSAKCAARFTSRSGFISGYDADWQKWGKLSAWDHNQIGTLLECFADIEHGGDFDAWAEFDLMESAFCNGAVDQWYDSNVSDAAKWQRAWQIRNYLRDRAERPNIGPACSTKGGSV